MSHKGGAEDGKHIGVIDQVEEEVLVAVQSSRFRFRASG
jgi:hypothetical protein